MHNTYKKLREYLNKYPGGIAWRLRKHCEVLDTHINEDESILYVDVKDENNFVTCSKNINRPKRIVLGISFK